MATITQHLDPREADFLASSFPALVKGGTNFPVMGLAYDAAADESAFWTRVATSYGSGNITVKILWYADTASSGDVIWGVQLAAITPNTDTQDVETDSLATANTATDTHLGTTGQRVHSVDVTVTNLDSIAADDIFFIKIYRDADAGGDTMTGDAILLWAVVTYSDA